jgi:hypothetical protein
METLVKEIVLSDQKRLKEQKIDELEQGLIIDGVEKREYRSAEYAIFKDNINPRADGYVDLLLTRRFSNGLFVAPFYSRAFIFDSTDSKRDLLVSKYSLDIMGINNDWFYKRQKDIYRLVLVQTFKKKYGFA